MSDGKVFALILIGCVMLVCVAVPGLAALGVGGAGLSLGAIVPAILGGFAVGRMGTHHSDTEPRR